MSQTENQILFALLHSAIYGTKLMKEERELYSSGLLADLQKLCTKHDVIHLLILGLKRNELIPKEDMGLIQHILKAVYRYERMNGEYEKLCNILEKAQIPFLPLKGSVIRKYYPEAWMRTSCDIDILVHEEDCERAKSILVNEYEYVYQGKGSHDISLFSPNNIHVELHHNLIEDGIRVESSAVLKNVWDTANICEGYNFWYEMSDGMYYFYHIAHMAKHFENGGCGIRPFIDLVILENIDSAEKQKRDKLLEKGKLSKFAETVRKLSRVWFENEEYDLISKQMEDYILRGGAYGISENRINVQQQKKGGRVKYALSKIFIPYDDIKFLYPILQKYRWLTPLMEVRRWFKFVFCGKESKRAIRELSYNSKIEKSEAENMKSFLKEIGL